MNFSRIAKWLGIALVAYVLLVCAFEGLVGYMGKRQAENGVSPDQDWIVVHTRADDGLRDTVVAGVDIDGHLYVAANHWPRGWFRRAEANPDLEVTRRGQRAPYHALAPEGAERERVARAYALPLAIRFLTGFPPREFLRLDPR